MSGTSRAPLREAGMNARGADVDPQSALDNFDYASADDAAFRECLLQTTPVLRTLGLDGGERVVLAAATGRS